MREGCYAFLHKAIHTLPVKLKTVKVRHRFFNYFLITDGDRILLNKRGMGDIWANMYDLPMIETTEALPAEKVMELPQAKKYFGDNAQVVDFEGPLNHILTHQKLKINFITLKSNNINCNDGWFFAEVESLNKFALPQIIFIFLAKFFTFK